MQVPQNIPISTTKAYLQHNSITYLPSYAFSQLTRCTELRLEYNGMTGMHRNAFVGLRSLQVLNLNRNALTQLPNFVFIYLSELQILHLGWNKISIVEKDAFRGLHKLYHLFFYRNDLFSLSALTFKHLPQIGYLFLSHNSISQIDYDAFWGLTKLEQVTIYGNKLTTIQSKWFQNQVRPLVLGASDPRRHQGDIPWSACEKMCWLKQEEEAKTIRWYESEEGVFIPQCAGNVDWNTLNCSLFGKWNI